MNKRDKWANKVSVIRQRIDERHPLLMKMLEVSARHDGQVAFPLPEDDQEGTFPILTAFTLTNAVDSLAMRATSTLPYWQFPTKNSSEVEAKIARLHKRAWAATAYESYLHLVMSKAALHLSAYDNTSLRVLWDRRAEMPRIVVENPLGTFAEPRRSEDPRPPCDVAYVYEMSAGEARYCYPATRAENGGPISGDARGQSELWTFAEWVDDEDIMIGLVGPKFPEASYRSIDQTNGTAPTFMLIAQEPNKAGMCTAVVPKQISLNDIAMQVYNAIGMSDYAGRFMALGTAALEKDIYPDKFALSDGNQNPEIIGRVWKDGRDGEINLLKGVSQVGQMNNAPNPMVWQVSERLQDNLAESLGLNAAQRGEAYGNMRTGRGIDTLIGIQTDPRVAQIHKIFEAYIPQLVKGTFATYRGYTTRQYSLYSGWPGDQGYVTFKAQELDPDRKMVAEYAIAGADEQQTTIRLQQLRATEAISMRTFRQKHPDIGDPESEEYQVNIEKMDQALFTGILQGIAAPPGTPGGIDPMTGSILYAKIKKGTEIYKAWLETQREVQEMQAQMAPPAPENMAAAPELMPGIGAPAMPMPQQPPPVQGPNDSQANIRRLALALKTNANISA